MRSCHGKSESIGVTDHFKSSHSGSSEGSDYNIVMQGVRDITGKCATSCGGSGKGDGLGDWQAADGKIRRPVDVESESCWRVRFISLDISE